MPERSGWLAWLLAALMTIGMTVGLALGVTRVEARPTGVTMPGLWQGLGCFCHGEPSLGTTILSSTIAAPTVVTAGMAVSITASVTGTTDQLGPLGLGGGLNLAVSRGRLLPGPTTRFIDDSPELTHLTRTATSWSVTWVAPPTNGPVLVAAVVLLANGDGAARFDAWTVVSHTITVVGGGEDRFVPLAALRRAADDG
jgi:hypothetical protein